MFKNDYRKLRLSFNKFHDIKKNDMPEYDEFCLLELKDGRYTGGKWHPEGGKKGTVKGKFARGLADTIPSEEVAKWHSLDRDNLANCLEDERVNFINLGENGDDVYSVIFKDFKSTRDGDCPKNEQYCLLILMNGDVAAGRWDSWREKNEGSFIYASALAQYSHEKVWAWTALSSDDTFAAEEELENERKKEEELNRNPKTDSEKFKYGTDIEVYYEKALEILKKEYPWASMAQMKKKKPWEIAPLHGWYVFGQTNKTYDGYLYVTEWNGEGGADEFIDFLCEYTKESVKNSNPEEKFKYGTDIKVYLDKAFNEVKKEYRWFEKKMIKLSYRYVIKEVNGDLEFVTEYKDGNESICEYGKADDFIEYVEYDYSGEALRANPVVATYEVPFGRVEVHGWYLERYDFMKMKTGDYKVIVQAGDRVTGGTREFFITPYCFEAKTYEEFLDRYLEIVPGGSFGLGKKELLPNKDLKKFLGY